MGNVKLLLEWVTVPLFIIALQLPQGAVLYWLASSLTALAQVRCVSSLPLFPVIPCHCLLSLLCAISCHCCVPFPVILRAISCHCCVPFPVIVCHGMRHQYRVHLCHAQLYRELSCNNAAIDMQSFCLI